MLSSIWLIAQLVQEDENRGIPPLVWIILLAILVALVIWWWLRSPKQSETHAPTYEARTHAVQPSAHTTTSHTPAKAAPSVAAVQPPPPPPVVEPVVQTAVVSQPPPPPAPVQPDDLTLVEGIGPKINTILQGAGIKTFKQLAETPVSDLRDLMLKANLRIADPASWPEQAALAAAGQMDELQKLQDGLKGGRKA